MMARSTFRVWSTVTVTCLRSTASNKLLIDNWWGNFESVNHLVILISNIFGIIERNWSVRLCCKVPLHISVSKLTLFGHLFPSSHLVLLQNFSKGWTCQETDNLFQPHSKLFEFWYKNQQIRKFYSRLSLKLRFSKTCRIAVRKKFQLPVKSRSWGVPDLFSFILFTQIILTKTLNTKT